MCYITNNKEIALSLQKLIIFAYEKDISVLLGCNGSYHCLFPNYPEYVERLSKVENKI